MSESITEFRQLALDESILSALDDMGFVAPTPGLAFRVAYEGDMFIEENVYQDYGHYSYSDDYAMNIGTFYAGATYKF